MGLTIGVDIGGTKVAAGVVDEQGQVLATVRRDDDRPMTRAQPRTSIAEVVRELGPRHPGRGASGSARPGFVDATRSIVRFAPNLGWREEPLRAAARAGASAARSWSRTTRTPPPGPSTASGRAADETTSSC